MFLNVMVIFFCSIKFVNFKLKVNFGSPIDKSTINSYSHNVILSHGYNVIKNE